MQSHRSQPVAPDLLQMEVEIQRRVTVAPNAGQRRPPPGKPNLFPIRAARSLANYSVNMDFSGPPPRKQQIDFLKRGFLQPFLISLAFGAVLFLLMYTVSVNKFVFYNISTATFNASLPLTIATSNCQIFLEPLGSDVPNTIQVRNTFSLGAINDVFQNNFDSRRNLMYLWRAKKLEACRVAIGIDNLSSQLNLTVYCLGNCTLISNPGSLGQFSMGRMAVHGGTIIISLNNITVNYFEFEGDIYAGNSVGFNSNHSIVIASQMYASRYQTNPSDSITFTFVPGKFGDVYPFPNRTEFRTITLSEFLSKNNFSLGYSRRARLMAQSIAMTPNPAMSILAYSNDPQFLAEYVKDFSKIPLVRVVIAQSLFYTVWPPLNNTDSVCTQSLRLEDLSDALYFNIVEKLTIGNRISNPMTTVFVINLWNFMGSNLRPVQVLIFPTGFASYLVGQFVLRWLFGSFYTYEYVHLHYVLGCQYFGMDNVQKAITVSSQIQDLVTNVKAAVAADGFGSSVNGMQFRIINIHGEKWGY